jgi:hypothetical protein
MERITAAIEAGETLEVIYHGGSQPGTLRAIIPRSIRGDKLIAVCVNSHTSKTFIIEKIEVVEEGSKQKSAKHDPRITRQKSQYESLDELLNENREFLETLGWHIERDTKTFQIADSHEQHCEHLFLYSHFKNGKLRKSPDIELSFEALTWDVFADSETPENIRKRVRPWTIRARKKQTKNYGNLDKAADLFLDWAVTGPAKS